MRMGNLFTAKAVSRAEMSSTRLRVGIDHLTVVPAPAVDEDGQSTPDPVDDEAS
jgi:hypothetical protein